jgi:ornithine cyclodeaminase/alanine dehydrogenase-like protein (mu-crystallin family)
MGKLEVLFLGQREVLSVLNMKQMISEIEKVFEGHGKGSVVLPNPIKSLLALEPTINGHFVAMPAYLDLEHGAAAGVKWISTFPDNPKRHGLSTSSAIVILNDPRTGIPVCLMEASFITAYRTGAATAVGALHLANKDSHVLGIIGASFQGRYQLLALAEMFDLKECKVYDIDQNAAAAYKSEMMRQLPSIKVHICKSYEEAVQESDIVVIATASLTLSPFFEGRWCKKGMLLISITAKSELKPEVLDKADKIVVDTIDGCMHQGALYPHFKSGRLKERDIYCEIGQIVVGEKKGRETEDEIILYVPMGVGTEDIAVAKKIYEIAKQKGWGTMLSLI